MKITLSAKFILGCGTLLSITGLFLAGCASAPMEHDGRKTATGSAMSAGKGGAQLWAESCVRCHNVRSPSIYSDAEWDVAMHHMRIRANLTAEESTKVLEFLKSAN